MFDILLQTIRLNGSPGKSCFKTAFGWRTVSRRNVQTSDLSFKGRDVAYSTKIYYQNYYPNIETSALSRSKTIDYCEDRSLVISAYQTDLTVLQQLLIRDIHNYGRGRGCYKSERFEELISSVLLCRSTIYKAQFKDIINTF